MRFMGQLVYVDEILLLEHKSVFRLAQLVLTSLVKAATGFTTVTVQF